METEVSETGRIHRGILDGGRGAVEMDLGEALGMMRRHRKLVTRISKVTQGLKVPNGSTSCIAIYTM